MSSRRVLKAAQAIREVVSMAILTEIKDPRVKDVTVTFVEVSADIRNAKVHVSVMGDDKKKELCLRGLKHAAGYLQKKVGNRIDTRYTPRVQFVLDKGVENSMLVTKILDEVLPKEDPTKDDPTKDDPANEDQSENTGENGDLTDDQPAAETLEAEPQEDGS